MLKENALHPFFQESLLSSVFIQEKYFSIFVIHAQIIYHLFVGILRVLCVPLGQTLFPFSLFSSTNNQWVSLIKSCLKVAPGMS